MRQITKAGLAAFAGGVALASAPAVSHAGVMSIADKASVGVDSQTTQVDWRPYVHRHHRWHPGWRWGYGPGARHWGYAPRWGYSRWGYAPRWGYSRWGYAPTVWGSAAPYCNYGAWGYSPAAGALGVAADVAAAPLWAAGALTSPVWW
ncbi:hypothetical protein WOC76_08320 [Methylocystis sp. IM3]|uniref:hypothetical protein n=1 Tax=unclassified Methylocystis TaxID=2625913 RepID=UPI0030FCC8F0